MTLGLALFLPFAVTGMAVIAAPQAALDNAQARAQCQDDSGETPAEAMVAACTALLESGRLTVDEHADALAGRAIGYSLLRDFAHAIADYQTALGIDPNSVWAHGGLGGVYRDQGSPQRAIEEYDIAIRLGEREITAAAGRIEQAALIHRIASGYYGRGLAYADLRDRQRAIADFREAVRRAPHEPEMSNSLCWNLAVMDEHLDEARAACDAALRDLPDDPPTLDSRGLVGLRQHRYQDAWNDYDAAARISPDGATWVYGRGIAAVRLGRTEEGRADITRAEALNAGVTQIYADFGIRP